MVSDVALTTDLAVILLSATVTGFIAKRTGQPTIIAYILAGVVIGPAVLGIVEVTDLTETLSELGLAFLLFLLGIKMRLDEIKHVLAPIVKISIPQMGAVALAGGGVALGLGFTPLESLLIGLAVMYSSTAVVIKSLTDKDEATSLHGKIDVGVLLVQDIVVVVLLAVLAAGRPDDIAEVATTLAVVLTLVAAITVVAIGSSRYVLPSVFRRVADNKEVFFLVAISWAFLFVFVSDEINVFLSPFGIEAYLSIEMGAFLAGIAIAQLPYSKELKDRINPLTDLFVMVFFVSVALTLEASELLFYWQEALVAAAVLMLVKFIVFFLLIDWQGFTLETTFLGSVGMIQISEFGIIVGVAAQQGGFIDVEVLGFLTLLALVTMAASVYFIEFNHELFERARPFLSRWDTDDGVEHDGNAYGNHAVVIGYDDVTRNALPMLADRYDDVVVVDRQTDHIEKLEAGGYDALYGEFRNAHDTEGSGGFEGRFRAFVVGTDRGEQGVAPGDQRRRSRRRRGRTGRGRSRPLRDGRSRRHFGPTTRLRPDRSVSRDVPRGPGVLRGSDRGGQRAAGAIRAQRRRVRRPRTVAHRRLVGRESG